MIQINADPHSAGYVYFPTHAVTALFAPEVEIQPILEELQADGFADGPIEVFTGKAGREQWDQEGLRHGWWVRLVREFEEVFADEFADLMQADQFLKMGGSVVIVFTLKDESKKQRAVAFMKAHQGQHVMYWGAWMIEHFSSSKQDAVEVGTSA